MVNRNLFNKIKRLLSDFPIVAIVGARQVGKTELSKAICPDWHFIDLEDPDTFDRVTTDPKFFFKQYPRHLIIDEAQDSPELFKVLRGVIDEQREERGRFLITGSSSPQLLTNISETLAGRIATVELSTLRSNEILEKELSPFFSIFSGTNIKKIIPSLSSNMNSSELQRFWLCGGYPEPTLRNEPEFFAIWMQEYFKTYIERDVRKLFPRLDLIRFRRLTNMLAHLTGKILNRAELSRTIEVSEPTVKDYLEIASGTFLWRSLSSFEKQVVKKVAKMPKGHLRDSGLMHYLLKINSSEELANHPIVRKSFEAFISEEIIKGISATNVTNWSAHHYRTRHGSEIDLIIDGPFGCIPIEIKHGIRVPKRNLISLKNFIAEKNLPLGIVVNNSSEITWLSQKILQLPATFL